MKKTIPYGRANYINLIQTNSYFVDKTSYIAKLEAIDNPIFLRPRKFGKSLLCSMLRYHYDLNYSDRFQELFGHTWIGQNPTGNQNQYMVLSLNFSSIDVNRKYEDIENSFRVQNNPILSQVQHAYKFYLTDMPEIRLDDTVTNNLHNLITYIDSHNLPSLYIIIDEYDNFSNQLIVARDSVLYGKLTDDRSFLKSFFKTIKLGRELGSVANTYITGVLPVMLDDLSSGYNIGTFLSLDPSFEHMLGFTQDEVDHLLDDIYHDYAIDPATRKEIDDIIKIHYNGYCFVDPEGEGLYNSTILMYFLRYFVEHKKIPKRLTDTNLKTDISWVQRLTASKPQFAEEFLKKLNINEQISYDESLLIDKFNLDQFLDESYFPTSFFYLGLLTRKNDFYLHLPNQNMRNIFMEYYNVTNHINVSTGYAHVMNRFVNNLDLEQLFDGYWELYISQLPEAIFTQVNENFYRTSFYELCNRHLSRWFTWNVERSYPSGKTDLEFVGKYHEKFANLRWVIEFKYYSGTKIKTDKIDLKSFELKAADTIQIEGYVENLEKEYPEAQIRQFVIYCFSNHGYRIFEI